MNVPRWLGWWVVLGLLVAGLFAMFIWPTPYRYHRLSVDPNSATVRINRITGESFIEAGPQGWIPVVEAARKARIEAENPPAPAPPSP